MTTVNVTVGGTDVSDQVTRIEYWDEPILGRFTIAVLNPTGIYSNFFAADAEVVATVDGAVYFRGYVDKIYPRVQDTPANKFEQILILSGRNYGQDLANKLYDGVYNDKADDIVADVLTKSGCEVTFTSPHAAPIIYYDCKAAKDIDTLREIVENINYIGRVSSTTKVWEMYPLSSLPSSGITLKSVKDDPTNNIIEVFDHVEADALDLYNYLIVLGQMVDDGWTEANAADWAVEFTGNFLYDNYGDDLRYVPRKGIAQLRLTRGVAADVGCKLIFPNFNYDHLNFSKMGSADLTFQIFQVGTIPGAGELASSDYPLIVKFKDDLGNVIQYDLYGVLLDQWETVTVPVGNNVKLETTKQNDKWYYSTIVSPPFTWLIKEIHIIARRSIYGALPEFYLDALKVPVQMIAIADYSGGSPYKLRKLPLNKRDINCQKELNEYALSLAAKKYMPIEHASFSAKGTIGLISGVWKWRYGNSFTLNIPDEKINSETWRFQQVHTILQRNVKMGFDHVVEVQTLPYDAPVDSQRWSYLTQGETGILRNLRDRMRYFEQKEIEVRDWYAGLPKPIAELYGQLPWKGLNINVPQDNMLLNGNFEVDENNDGVPDNWSKGFEQTGGGGTVSLDKTIHHEGTQSLKIYCSGATKGEAVASDPIAVQPNKTYLVRVMAKANLTPTDGFYFRIFWFANKTSIARGDEISYTDIVANGPLTTTFTEYSGIAAAPSNAYFCRIIVYNWLTTGIGGISFYFDAVWMWKQISWIDLIMNGYFDVGGLPKFTQKFRMYAGAQDCRKQYAAENAGYYVTMGLGICDLIPTGYFKLDCGSMPSYYVWIGENIGSMKHDEDAIMSANVKVSHSDVETAYVGVGDLRLGAGQYGWGFEFTDGTIYAITNNGGYRTRRSLMSYTAGVWYNVEARKLTDTEVEFFINGISQGKNTTNMPSVDHISFWLYVDGDIDHTNRILEVIGFTIMKPWWT